MPSGVYVRTEEGKQNMKIAQNRPEVRAKRMGENNPMKRPEIVAQFIGNKNPSKRPDVQQKMRESAAGRRSSPLSEEHKKAISLALQKEKHPNWGKKLSQKHRENLSASHIGKHPSKEAIEKNRCAHKGRNNCMYGKHPSEETKRKMRIAALNRCKYIGLRFGKNETKLLDLQEQKDGIKIMRSYYISGLGYVADGYCEKTNTIYEVYENHHNRQIQKDFQRETEICNCLCCDFIIIWDK